MWQEWEKSEVGGGGAGGVHVQNPVCVIFLSSVEGLFSLGMDSRLLPKSHRLIGFGIAS